MNRDRSTIYERLSVLKQQGYITKQYNGSYKIAGKPATYCLSTKGIGALIKLKPTISRSGLRNMYRNQSVTQQYINHCLSVLAVATALQQKYSDDFTFFSKNEISNLEGFPTPKPDLFLQSKAGSTKPNYMLDVFDNEADFMTRRKRLKTYMEYEGSGDWSNAGLNTCPSLLFVVASDKIQTRIMKEVAYFYSRYYIDEHEVATMVTTLNKLTNMTNSNDPRIWRIYESDENELTSLRAI